MQKHIQIEIKENKISKNLLDLQFNLENIVIVAKDLPFDSIQIYIEISSKHVNEFFNEKKNAISFW